MLRLGNEMGLKGHHQGITNRSYCLRQGLDLTNPLSCRKRPKIMSSLSELSEKQTPRAQTLKT